MTRRTGIEIVVLASHARAVAAAERERFGAILRAGLPRGGLVLETCHRVEGYSVSEGPSEIPITMDVPDGARALRGEAAIRHAIAVAVGRDSVVVGEDQVLHQLRTTVDRARAAGGLDPALERLFATALRSGRLARSWRNGPERSLGGVAVAEIERQIGPLTHRRVLIVGAGRMGRLAARAAAAAGATVAIANRSPAAAAALAKEVAGEAVPFDPGRRADEFAAVVVAIGGAWSIEASSIERFVGSAVVVDLSVPSALDPDLTSRLGRRLVTADDLARVVVGEIDADRPYARRLDALIDVATADVLQWLDDHGRRATAAALADRADAARRTELDALWRQLPNLDPDSRSAIESMTRHLSDRLLREPLERLSHDGDGEAERAIRRVFAL